ncbi:KUP/HAK/KT family potassium transporter [Atopobium fossor]|uniref:KUP/HAK/KT family potassium transporter n=1 Tax=Atopobium fossor TaxID=39487 RepID=UPI000417E1BD|nr:KUP/HAK/KT family potassium transporter [Atopobium fossor]
MQACKTASVKKRKSHSIPLSAGMILVTLGIVYGDIGTSPMYTLKAIMAGNGGLATMSENTVLGALSLIIWTLTLITTVKYVLVAMRADNHNEGGIFALYSLVKRNAKWLIIPAMLGGAALLADGILTPAVTVTTAIEGLRTIDPIYDLIGDNQSIVVAITIAILCALFVMQRAGTSTIGKAFGPIMTIWFLYLGITGFLNLTVDFGILRALNPIRGLVFLFDGSINHAGLMVLGNVFLCTTGAEALYSDMGHVGKPNIYVSWPFVKVCLILNYLGQGAWILAHRSDAMLASINDLNPFFQMLPEELRAFAVILSTFAAIIASQALITGSYSIVSEAIRLNLMPHLKINYPSETKGQIYIPLVNNIMWAGCIGVVLLFQSSSHMEAAYGLAITVTMLMTTILLFTYISKNLRQMPSAIIFVIIFGAIELMFFFSSLTKFFHGGYVTVLLGFSLFVVMYVWRRGTAVERTQSVYLPVKSYLDQIYDLVHDDDYPMTADNLVFLTNDSSFDKLDRDILYSILDKRPKRAKAYYFLNVQVTDEPYTREFVVNNFGTDFLFKVQIRLGFRVNQRINTYLYQIVEDLMNSGQLAPQEHKYSIYREHSKVGDFRFCLLRKMLSPETDISGFDQRVITFKYLIRRLCGSPARWYGLEGSNVLFEYVPLFSKVKQGNKLTRKPFDPTETKRKLTNVPTVATKKDAVVATTVNDDDDIFSAAVEDDRSENFAHATNELVGGDTASFAPLVLDEDDEDDSSSDYEASEDNEE